MEQTAVNCVNPQRQWAGHLVRFDPDRHRDSCPGLSVGMGQYSPSPIERTGT